MFRAVVNWSGIRRCVCTAGEIEGTEFEVGWEDNVAAAFRMWDEQTFRKKFPYESKEVELHPRPFHPLLLEERVGIPTVHIQGAMDKVRPQGEVLVGLCE